MASVDGSAEEQTKINNIDVHTPRTGLIGWRSEMVKCNENEQQIWAADHNMTTVSIEIAFLRDQRGFSAQKITMQLIA